MTAQATQQIDQQIREVLVSFPQIQLVILFGSVAAGSANFESDLDLALKCETPIKVEQKIKIIEALALKLGRPVDLVDLYDPPEPLLGQILQHGRRVMGADHAYAQLLNRHVIAQADFLPLKNRILEERRTAWIGK